MTDFGNTAAGSSLTRKLQKKRDDERKAFESTKEEIAKKAEAGSQSIGDKFAAKTMSTIEEAVTAKGGLITYDDFVKRTAAVAAGGGGGSDSSKERKSTKNLKGKSAIKSSALSFDFGDDDDDDGGGGGDDDDGDGERGPEDAEADERPAKRAKFVKDPTVDTDFLPDQEREEAEEAERKRLAAEWTAAQTRIKAQRLDITYSYWDGSGHRKTTTVTKGSTVSDFLDQVRRDFPQELRGVATENLIYVKEDLIIPQHLSFYELIVSKARGKSGPLFHFDVHDDIRIVADATVEKDESHAGKVCERRWYERNKHIFPASRWEVYDPNKDYGEYTIHGGEVV